MNNSKKFSPECCRSLKIDQENGVLLAEN